MSDDNSKRSWSQRTVPWLAAAVALPAIGWGVNELLDAGSDSLNGKPPVRVAVESDPARVFAPSDPGWQTYGFVSQANRAGLGQPPSELCREWRNWAIEGGGVDADQTRLYAFLQGVPDTAVAVTGLDVEVVRRKPAVSGTHAWCPAGGAVGSPRLVDIDLDTSPPTIRYAEAGDDFPARKRLLLTLNGTETETLQISAHTRRCDCAWRLILHLVVDTERREVIIDDGGEPFRTSASTRSSHVAWTGKRWERMSRAEWRKTLPMRWAHFTP